MPKASLAAAHRKSGVNTAAVLNFPARWSHTKSSVHYDYNSLLLPRIAECNWKIWRAECVGEGAREKSLRLL
jgi:hypothetical protein